MGWPGGCLDFKMSSDLVLVEGIVSFRWRRPPLPSLEIGRKVAFVLPFKKARAS